MAAERLRAGAEEAQAARVQGAELMPDGFQRGLGFQTPTRDVRMRAAKAVEKSSDGFRRTEQDLHGMLYGSSQ
jgi:hypothetical protein